MIHLQFVVCDFDLEVYHDDFGTMYIFLET